MEPMNVLDIRTREEFRRWLAENCFKESECWVEVKRGRLEKTD